MFRLISEVAKIATAPARIAADVAIEVGGSAVGVDKKDRKRLRNAANTAFAIADPVGTVIEVAADTAADAADDLLYGTRRK